MKRHYYAFYCPYGINTAFNEYHIPIVKMFATKKERDEWVENDKWIDGNFYREAATYKEAKRWMNKAC